MDVQSVFVSRFGFGRDEAHRSATRESVASASALTGLYLAMNAAATLLAGFGLLQNEIQPKTTSRLQELARRAYRPQGLCRAARWSDRRRPRANQAFARIVRRTSRLGRRRWKQCHQRRLE